MMSAFLRRFLLWAGATLLILSCQRDVPESHELRAASMPTAGEH
jgi:hypothetical protein